MTKFMFVLSLGVALVAGSVRLSAQKQQQIFISLTGTDGKPVEGLQAADVGITEDDVNCKIIKVESIDWPTKLQVLVDNGRANTNPINPLRDGLKALIDMMPEGTEISLYTTAGTPRNVDQADHRQAESSSPAWAWLPRTAVPECFSTPCRRRPSGWTRTRCPAFR